MIRFVSDSTSDLTKELIEKYDIRILPLYVHLGDEEYIDGVNITPNEIYAWSDKNNTTPKTSAMSIDAAKELFTELTQNGDEVIAFCISETMSASGSVMRLAADAIDKEDYVHVVDSEHLSAGIALMVIEAAEMAKNGSTVDQILKRMDELKPIVRTSFVVDTLVFLHRGGRCSGIAALAGGALKLHPMIKLEDGKMGPGKKYRGRINKVIMDYVHDLEPELVKAKKDIAFIVHSGCEAEIVEEVKSYLKGLNHFDDIIESRAGGVISCHCGPGTLGVLFIGEEK